MRKATKHDAPYTYTLLHEICASDKRPLTEGSRKHQLKRMHDCFTALKTADTPHVQHWRVVSDCVNLMETFLTENNGWWTDCSGDLVQVVDSRNLLMDAVEALAKAGHRHLEQGAKIRLDAAGITAVASILEDYEAILEALPHRAVVKCHRLTERRIREIHAGKRRPHDVEVIAI